MKEWSGRWDSNPRLDLGKVPYYPYTTTARTHQNFITTLLRRQDPIGILSASGDSRAIYRRNYTRGVPQSTPNQAL